MPKWLYTKYSYYTKRSAPYPNGSINTQYTIKIIIPRYHLHAQMAQHTVYDHNYYNTKRSPSCPNGSTHSSYTIIITGVSRQLFKLSKVTAQVDA